MTTLRVCCFALIWLAAAGPASAQLPGGTEGKSASSLCSKDRQFHKAARVFVDESAAQAVRKVEPAADLWGHVGTVVVCVLVGPDGYVKDAVFAGGNDALAEPALSAARKWEFYSFLLNGKAVEFETQITFKFSPPANERY